MPSRPSRTPDPGPFPGWLRLVLGTVLVMLVGAVALWFPVLPAEEWPRPYRFEPDPEACAEERQARQWTRFRVPEEAGVTTVAEVARKHQLETGWICRANGRRPDCGDDRLTAGQELVLPLQAQAVEAARRAPREVPEAGSGPVSGSRPGGRP